MTESSGNGSGHEELAQALRQFLAYPVRTTAETPVREREQRRPGDLKESVEQAIGNVLGWRRRPGRIDGVLSALEQAFERYEEDGRVLYRHRPNTVTFHGELEGGVVGAQASLHVRAAEAFNRVAPLLERLEPLTQTGDLDIAAAAKHVISSEFREVVTELGRLGGPRVARVDELWSILLGSVPQTDPDAVGGQLGRLRDVLGLVSRDPAERVNDPGEEQQLTDFRIISDDLVSLRASWDRDKNAFGATAGTTFLGVQLVVLERQLAVVTGSVRELRTAFESVLIDADQRRTRPVRTSDDEQMFLEDLLDWIEDFSAEEGVRLARNGGRLAITGALHSTARRLRRLVEGVIEHERPNGGPVFGSLAVDGDIQPLEEHLFEVARATAGPPSDDLHLQWSVDEWEGTIPLIRGMDGLYRTPPYRFPPRVKQVEFKVYSRKGPIPWYPTETNVNFTAAVDDRRHWVMKFDPRDKSGGAEEY